MITRTSLLLTSAAALALYAAPVTAQTQQQESPPSGMPGGSATGGEQRAQQQDKDSKRAQTQPREDKGKGTAQTQQRQDKGTERAQAEQRQDKTKGKDSAQTQQQRGDERKGTAQTQQQPQQDRGKGSAQTQQQREGKGTAQTQQAQPDKGAGSAQTDRRQDKGTASDTSRGTAQTNESGGKRVQLSDKQRTDVHSTVLKESNVNRATDVNISINVGTKLPRSVRLAPLPASIVSTVPEFRSFQYVVVEDQIAIVDPKTFEIVEVISGGPGRAASMDRGGQTQLTLTEEEKNIILSEVEMSRDSTMGLGAMTEGADVPRNAALKSFPESVVQQVPKVRNHKFFTAEDRVAIVDPQGSKVQLVIGSRQ